MKITINAAYWKPEKCLGLFGRKKQIIKNWTIKIVSKTIFWCNSILLLGIINQENQIIGDHLENIKNNISFIFPL